MQMKKIVKVVSTFVMVLALGIGMNAKKVKAADLENTLYMELKDAPEHIGNRR